jgi:hypothetical protein
MLLLSFLVVIAPGGALMFFILRFIKAHAQVGIARTDTARAEARMIGAQEAAAIAGETARTALGQTTEALAIARTIETVGEQVSGLTEYLVAKIDGEPPARRPARHARALPPGANDLPAIGNRMLP